MTNLAKVKVPKGVPTLPAKNTVPMIVERAKWEALYEAAFRKFLRNHETFDGSAVAAALRKGGLIDPPHHNLWGAQFAKFRKLGWIEKIGKMIPTGAAHIQTVAEWRSTKYVAPRAKGVVAKPVIKARKAK